jgi:hypothetical protein
VAKGTGQREVGTKRFVRETKVILKIAMQDDKDVKLLSYKIKLDGAVKVESAPDVLTETTETTEQTTSIDPQPTNSDSTTTTNAEQTTKKTTWMDKIKKKAKEETKKVVKDNLND